MEMPLRYASRASGKRSYAVQVNIWIWIELKYRQKYWWPVTAVSVSALYSASVGVCAGKTRLRI